MRGSEIFVKKWGGGNPFKPEYGRDLNHCHYIDYTMLHCCLHACLHLAVTTACSGRVAASRRNAFFKYFLLFKVLCIHKNYQLIFKRGGGA